MLNTQLLPVKLPEKNKPVNAVIRINSDSVSGVDCDKVKLMIVDGVDSEWRFIDDWTALPDHVDVIYWEYV